MAGIHLEVITAERVVFTGDVDIVIAPGIDGELGILPEHTPLMTTLKAGELSARKDGQEFSMVVSGGFLEVRPDKVIVLADAAERDEEIDLAKAEEAKRRAQESMLHPAPGVDMAKIEAELFRSLAELKVVRKKKQRPPTASS